MGLRALSLQLQGTSTAVYHGNRGQAAGLPTVFVDTCAVVVATVLSWCSDAAGSLAVRTGSCLMS
jgi:hypothetical protein